MKVIFLSLIWKKHTPQLVLRPASAPTSHTWSWRVSSLRIFHAWDGRKPWVLTLLLLRYIWYWYDVIIIFYGVVCKYFIVWFCCIKSAFFKLLIFLLQNCTDLNEYLYNPILKNTADFKRTFISLIEHWAFELKFNEKLGLAKQLYPKV